MAASGKLLSVELLVEGVERTIELLSGVLGLELIERRPATDVAGEIAILQAGDVAITLFAPAAEGPGRVLAERTPRLSQLVFAATDDAADPDAADPTITLRDRALDAGLAVEPLGARGFFVTPECAEGVLGTSTAIVVLDPPS
jgi:catechol 2,3-dioxygenase-like lactoylglutathione lyase family enzyme